MATNKANPGEQPSHVLIVDEDPVVAARFADLISSTMSDRFQPTMARTVEEALDRLGRESAPRIAVAVIDLSINGARGLELIRTMRERGVETVPIAVTGYGTIESAVEAIRLGAVDYLVKPLVDEELLVAIEKAFSQFVLLSENADLRQQLEGKFGLDNIVGRDPRMQRIYETIEAVAPSRTTVLMAGESGTGKSLVARAVHRRSTRSEGPFVEISCGSIPETLLESELFGHMKGAFTGAHADKQGRFLAADGGTIFLDEINSASPGMQLKLLRVLQERRFEPVGSTETLDVDVRIILASNQPLEQLVEEGSFRQDLYYRINVVMIQLPPLRDRLSDIPVLADHFLQQHAREAGREILGINEEAMDALRRYRFPGNVRELQNIMERAVVLSRGTRIDVDDLPEHVVENAQNPLLAGGGNPTEHWSPMPLAEALREPERQIILAALNAHDWNRQQTADALQINRTTLYKKIKQYGLEEYGQAG